jgi:hypothetical protein
MHLASRLLITTVGTLRSRRVMAQFISANNPHSPVNLRMKHPSTGAVVHCSTLMIGTVSRLFRRRPWTENGHAPYQQLLQRKLNHLGIQKVTVSFKVSILPETPKRGTQAVLGSCRAAPIYVGLFSD